MPLSDGEDSSGSRLQLVGEGKNCLYFGLVSGRNIDHGKVLGLHKIEVKEDQNVVDGKSRFFLLIFFRHCNLEFKCSFLC